MHILQDLMSLRKPLNINTFWLSFFKKMTALLKQTNNDTMDMVSVRMFFAGYNWHI